MLGPARLVRGWIAALVATVLAAGSHTVAGVLDASSMAGAADGPAAAHAAPPVAVLVLTLALSGLVCTGLAGQVLSWWRLLGAVGASQLLYHGAYTLSSGHAGTDSSGAAALVDPHAHHRLGSPALSESTLTVASGSASGMESAGGAASGLAETLSVTAHDTMSVTMLAAHVVAAVLTVAVLRAGERAVLATVAWLVLERPAALLMLWRPAVPTPVVPAAPTVGLRWQPTPVLECLWLRGPPVSAVGC